MTAEQVIMSTTAPHISLGAEVSADAQLGPGSRVWPLAVIAARARLAADCAIGRGAFVGEDVELGAHCSVQDRARLNAPSQLGVGVFVGPGAVLTSGVVVHDGASLGARTVCVQPVTIGAHALVASGSVITQDVPDYAFVSGAPARRVGWVGRAGRPLVRDGEHWVCPVTGERYVEQDGSLRAA